jgi:hypothetical protein
MVSRKKTRTSGKNKLSNAQIACIIEQRVCHGHTLKAITQCFKIGENGVRYYVDQYYYGLTKGPTMTIVIESALNDMDLPVEEYYNQHASVA